MKMLTEDLSQRLQKLLEQRLAIIGDHELRGRDPASQLDQLRRVSEEITSLHQEHQGSLPPRLNHYLERASFSKALAWLKGEEV
jgi:hypothetical protein